MEEKKKYKTPPVAWLKVTEYMAAWLQYELGGGVRVGGQKVARLHYLPGAKDVLLMETLEDTMEMRPIDNSMSATRHGCYEEGLTLDADVMEKVYGVTRKQFRQYVPIECPMMCRTRNGVIRPWTHDVCFGKKQAAALLCIVRDAFWQAVEEFDQEYARMLEGKSYPAVDMIEAFCRETRTPDLYVESIRREWQRRQKRAKDAASHAQVAAIEEDGEDK